MKTYIVEYSATYNICAETEEEAEAIVDEWDADDFTEDFDCSRSWEIRID